MELPDQYEQWTGGLTTSLVGPSPLIGVAVYAGLPVLIGRLLGWPKLGIGVSALLLLRLVQGQQGSVGPSEPGYGPDYGPDYQPARSDLTFTVPPAPRMPDLYIRYPAPGY